MEPVQFPLGIAYASFKRCPETGHNILAMSKWNPALLSVRFGYVFDVPEPAMPDLECTLTEDEFLDQMDPEGYWKRGDKWRRLMIVPIEALVRWVKGHPGTYGPSEHEPHELIQIGATPAPAARA